MSKFSLFRSHLDLAHQYWKRLVASHDIIIDATCGNGHDTRFLASLKPQKIYAIDIQEKALNEARKRIEEDAAVSYILGCHSQFPKEIQKNSVKLIVYNLGYLPGGNKSKTTLSSTTIQSLNNAMPLVCAGGMMSITCYPGHDEGQKEQGAVLSWAENLDKSLWSCCHHTWINRSAAPTLLLIQKDQKGT